MNRKIHLVSLAVAAALAGSLGVAFADQQSGPSATATATEATSPSDQLASIVVTATGQADFIRIIDVAKSSKLTVKAVFLAPPAP